MITLRKQREILRIHTNEIVEPLRSGPRRTQAKARFDQARALLPDSNKIIELPVERGKPTPHEIESSGQEGFQILSARIVSKPDGNFPGVCELQKSGEVRYGYFVPYQRLQMMQGLAVIDLLVHDLSRASTFLGFIPFVIDTGSTGTVIPRKLLPSNAFPIRESTNRRRVVIDAQGRKSFAHSFMANLTIASSSNMLVSRMFL